jgi:hypothetical protein
MTGEDFTLFLFIPPFLRKSAIMDRPGYKETTQNCPRVSWLDRASYNRVCLPIASPFLVIRHSPFGMDKVTLALIWKIISLLSPRRGEAPVKVQILEFGECRFR